MTENEEFLIERYRTLLNMSREQGKLPASVYVSLTIRDLNTADEIEEAYKELIHFLQNHEYYDTIERIEKGEALLQKERNQEKRRKYQARLNELYAKLERLKPEEGAAWT